MDSMKNWREQFYKNNKAIIWAAGIAIVLSVGVLVAVKDEVTRFTLIMPIFAGFILFSILVTSDEELEDTDSLEKEDKDTKKNTTKKTTKK